LVDPNTRQGKRTPVTLKIKFKSETLEQFIERYAVDVSQGGIFIRTKEPLAVGTQMKFEFQLRDASPLIAGEGTVVWTRENDPSRPAIAPGMGVRFDQLAEGSQGILERILTEKAKQAPQRPATDTSKPPLFTDTPTRVAPAPVQEALLGKNAGRTRRGSDEPASDSHTPLPKPMPFHSDADEFPDEAFEEATKVRALDELIAQTAGGSQLLPTAPALLPANGAAADDLALRKAKLESSELQAALERAETQEAPGLPSPPEPASRPLPKLLDASPSPRVEGAQPAFVAESLAKTRLGFEPARPRSMTPGPGPGPGPGPAPSDASPLSAGVRAVAAEHTEPARLPPAQTKSIAPIAVLILLLIAGIGAAVWFLVLRPRTIEQTETTPPSVATGSAAQPGSAAVPPAVGSAAVGSAAPAQADSAPKGELVDTVVASSEPGATVAIEGTDQSGPAPFTARLEKGKPYKAKLTAKGFAALELDVKGGDGKQVGKLVGKPRVIQVTSDPEGALLWIDNSSTGHTTPFSIELTPAQAAKKSVHVQIRKSGYRTVDRVVDLGKLTEDDTQLSTKLDEKLAAQASAPAGGAGVTAPSGGVTAPSGGPVTHPGGGGSDTPAPTPDSAPAPAPDKPAADKPAEKPADKPAAEKPAEPEPEFKPQQ
jgi:uncharacterized protein (TIGR02266 family)